VLVEHSAYGTQALDVVLRALTNHPTDSLVALEGDEHTGAWYRSAIGIDLIRERAVDR
jgi:hypothetical protein